MIMINHNIQGGMPVIKGTRITVLEILQALKSGFSFDEIISRSKYAGVQLNRRQIEEAIKYACDQVNNQ